MVLRVGNVFIHQKERKLFMCSCALQYTQTKLVFIFYETNAYAIFLVDGTLTNFKVVSKLTGLIGLVYLISKCVDLVSLLILALRSEQTHVKILSTFLKEVWCK